MLVVDEVSKKLSGNLILDQVSFSLNQGEALGVLGSNGAGKSTLFSLLAGCSRPNAGQIFLNSKPIELCKSDIGFAPDTPVIYSELTVREFLNYAASLRCLPKKRRAAAVEAVVALCDLEKYLNCLCGHLSKGMAQRLNLAQSMIHDPGLILLDEAFSGLDPEQLSQIVGILKSISQRKILIVSTHRLSDLVQLCDRALILQEGRVANMLGSSEFSSYFNNHLTSAGIMAYA